MVPPATSSGSRRLDVHGTTDAGTAGDAPAKPTIKGVFVKSHIASVRDALGDEGVEELQRRVGLSLDIRNRDDVPVRDEVRIIEHALDLLSDRPIPPEDRAFEAGRLHFRNFTTTPWARVLFSLFPRNYRFMVLHAKTVAERVFNGVQLDSEDVSPNCVRVVMSNNDYPIDHFRGLFQEWMDHFDYKGTVEADEPEPGVFIYTMRWE